MAALAELSGRITKIRPRPRSAEHGPWALLELDDQHEVWVLPDTYAQVWRDLQLRQRVLICYRWEKAETLRSRVAVTVWRVSG